MRRSVKQAVVTALSEIDEFVHSLDIIIEREMVQDQRTNKKRENWELKVFEYNTASNPKYYSESLLKAHKVFEVVEGINKENGTWKDYINSYIHVEWREGERQYKPFVKLF